MFKCCLKPKKVQEAKSLQEFILSKNLKLKIISNFRGVFYYSSHDTAKVYKYHICLNSYVKGVKKYNMYT